MYGTLSLRRVAMDYQTIIQVINLVMSIGLFIQSILWMRSGNIKWYMGLPPAVYLGHAIIFYGAILICAAYGTLLSEITGLPNFSGSWSSVLRFHGIATIGAYLYIAKQCSMRIGDKT